MNKIHIFKTGKHTAMNGTVIDFTEEMLKAAVAAYDPAIHQAPLVVGHPKLDDPAYGWAQKLEYADGDLYAVPEQVDTEFAEMVNKGRFKNISPSFYLPDSPNNPKPGSLYVKHIGFLGAAAPAVKGLKQVSFAADEKGIVEFTDWSDMNIAWIFRNIREFFIEKFGIDAADKAIPSYSIDSIQNEAAQDNSDEPSLSYSQKDDDMTPEQKAEFDKLKADNAELAKANETLKAQNASFAEAQIKAKTEKTHADNVAFAEGLVNEGKLLPVNKATTIALLDKLAVDETKVEFGEGDAKKAQTPLEIYKAQLSAGPKLIEYGEKGGGKAPDDEDKDPAAIAKEATDYAEAEAAKGRYVNAAEAVAFVTNKNK